MSKPRDFSLYQIMGAWYVRDRGIPDEGDITVREVVPIDWDKVWEKYWEKFEGQNHKIGDDYIQQLVEKQLRGEE